jgi:hypothetical protein
MGFEVRLQIAIYLLVLHTASTYRFVPVLLTGDVARYLRMSHLQ